MGRHLLAGGLAVGVSVAWPDLISTNMPWALILLALMVLDCVLALAAAARPGGEGIHLDRLWGSACKALAYYASVLVLYLMGAYHDGAWALIPGLYLFWSALESISCLGHITALGAPVPDFVRDWFEALRPVRGPSQ